MAKINCVKTEKFEIEYLSFGNGKKTLVIIPGLSVKSVIPSADTIEKSYEKFKDDYTIYLFDRKKQIETDYSIEQMADDTYEAINSLGLNDIYLIGVSQGGMIALTMAIKHPDIAKAMIITSSASRICDFSKSQIKNWITLASKNEKEELAKVMAHDVYSEGTVSQYKEMLIEPSANASDYEISKFIKLATAILNYDVYEQLNKIKAPMFIIGAQNDNVLTANASIEIAEKTGCESYIYDGYSHAVYDEAPDYKARLKQFFDKY